MRFAAIFAPFISLCLFVTAEAVAQCSIQGPSGTVCADGDFDFAVSNPENANYEWDFDGDGNADATGAEVTHRFPGLVDQVTYTINLLKDGQVCATTSLTVQPTPDASLGLPASGGAVLNDGIISVCSGGPSATISVFNDSKTAALNTSYTIKWGDGSSPETFDNSTFNGTSLVTHTYDGFGFYNLELTVKGGGSCSSSRLYRVYVGSNPSVGLGNPGNTVGLCAPVTLTFPITGTVDNPPGTIYNVYINGQNVATYNQNNLPNYYTHTFTESSCGETTSTGNYQNAFDLQIIASNPCGSSTATVEPIEVSEPPVPLFTILDNVTCTGSSVVFQNASEVREVGNGGNCSNQLLASWAISGIAGQDWELVNGNLFSSNEVEVNFKNSGDYEITITVSSPSCGELSYSETVNIGGGISNAGASLSLDTQGSCAPGTISFVNRSKGAGLEFDWDVNPGSGWSFTGGTDASSKDPEIKIEKGGSYTFRMEAGNLCGTVSWDTTVVFQGPPAVELIPPADACQSAVLNFDDTLVEYDDKGNPITEYYWEFPDADVTESREKYPQGINYTSTGVYAYRVAVTNACGTSSAKDTLRVIDPGAVEMPTRSQICETADPITLKADPRGGIWAGPGISADGKFRPVEAGIGTHTLTYRFGDGNCQVDGSMQIEVTAPPTVNAGSDLTVCAEGAPLSLGGSPGGGTWSGEGVSGGKFDPKATGEGSFQLYYTVTDGGGCAAVDSVEMVVPAPPTVGAEDLLYCESSSDIALPEGQPSGGTWSGPGVTNNAFNPQQAGGEGEYTLRYTVTEGNGCTGTTAVKATVLGSGAINAGPDRTVCASDGLIDLSEKASPAGGKWISSGGGVSGSSFDPSKVSPGTLTLTYSVDQGDCTLKDELQMEVLSTPKIKFGNTPSFICDSENSVSLEASPSGGTWTASAGASLNGNVFDPAASGPGTYTFTYSIEAGSCSVEKSIDIAVGSIPNVHARDTVYCDGLGRMTLPSGNPAGGRWIGAGVENDIYFFPDRAGGPGKYTLEYRYVKGGCVATTNATVTVVATVPVDAGPDRQVCESEGPIELSGFSPEGGRWNGPGISDGRLGAFDPEGLGGATHQVIYSVGNSGCVVRDTLELEVIEPLDVDAGADLAVCPGDGLVELSGAAPGGGTWSGDGVAGKRFDPAQVEPGNYVLTYSVTDAASGCVTQDKRKVKVNPAPNSLFSVPAATCTDDVIPFNNESLEATSYRWDFGDGQTSSETKPEHTYSEKGNYQVLLISTNDFGCSDTLQRSITIAQPPSASFAPDVDRGCSVLSVNFQNASGGDNVSYEWDFGNGMQSTDPNPGTIPFEQGTADTSYFVSLTVRNQCATAVHRDTVTVLPQPLADFGTPVDTSCSPMEVEFTNRTLGLPDSFLWDLGNGVTTTDSVPPNQVYTTDTSVSVYTITLIARNSCGQDTASRDIFVKPVGVRAFFNVPALQSCAPYEVQFNNLATQGTFVQWDFGDGNISSDQNPLYTFEDPGEYTVRQYATNGCGLDSVEQTITVLPSPEVAYSHPDYACVGEEVLFTNATEGIMGQKWIFGDGDSSQLRSPVHAFESPGTYTIRLTAVSNMNGCPAIDTSRITVLGNPDAAFEPSDKEGCGPLMVTFNNLAAQEGFYYEWDFGDGNTSNVDYPTHIFSETGTYRVKLTVTDPNGCSAADTSYQNITVYPEPKADFDFEKEVFCGVPVDVILDNKSSDATGFKWDFDDGTTSAFNQPGRHTYFEGGFYDVTLVASNTFTCADTIRKTVEVFPLPEARYEIDNRRGCVPLNVNFANASSANHYYWDFGDGSGSLEASPTHTYTQPGDFDVRLIVSYDQVCYDTLELKAEVTALPSPKAGFDVVADPDGPPGSVIFKNTSTDATKYYWEFGDGSYSEDIDPRYRFMSNGPREIYLEATNVYGCVDDILQVVEPPLIRGLFIPNAFSPEAGLGEVRLFKPKGIGLKEYHVQVFSPYGELVWESDKLEEGQPAESWDGTKNGQLLPQDVYVWKAYGVFEDGTAWRGMPDGSGNYKFIGSVTLLR